MRRRARSQCAAGPIRRGCGSRCATTGPGLQPQELERLFEPFYRGEIVRQRVPGHRHGPGDHARPGRRRRRARLGRERRPARRGVHHRACRRRRGRSTTAELTPMAARILIVDDEPSILATMAPLLRGRGYEVSTATTGHAALDAVDRAAAAARHPRSRAAGSRRHRGLPPICARGARCRSSCSRRAAPSATRWRRSTPAPTTTSPSRSARRSCWRACARRCGGPSRHRRGRRRDRPRRSVDRRRSPSRRRAAPTRLRLTPKEFELLRVPRAASRAAC